MEMNWCFLQFRKNMEQIFPIKVENSFYFLFVYPWYSRIFAERCRLTNWNYPSTYSHHIHCNTFPNSSKFPVWILKHFRSSPICMQLHQLWSRQLTHLAAETPKLLTHIQVNGRARNQVQVLACMTKFIKPLLVLMAASNRDKFLFTYWRALDPGLSLCLGGLLHIGQWKEHTSESGFWFSSHLLLIFSFLT